MYHFCNLRARVQCLGVNKAACDLARKVANEGDALVAGGLSETPSYLSGTYHIYRGFLFRFSIKLDLIRPWSRAGKSNTVIYKYIVSINVIYLSNLVV